MGEELGLVGGHVDIDRALLTAALAGQAQVERVAYLTGPPAVGDDLAAHHLHQHPGPAPGGMLLFPGRPVTRAHHAALVAPALANADAAGCGGRERAAVLRVAEERDRIAREPAAQRQILIEPVGPHDLAWVHLVARIERGLELTERADQLSREHLRQQLAPGLTIAVLAGQRSAV